MSEKKKTKPGHIEIIGETIAKFELFEQGWNPYSRFLDIDKIDLILRKRTDEIISYREIQVKYGKLHECGQKWEKKIFDYTSWRPFKKDEFQSEIFNKSLFIIYVLSYETGYKGDLFVFPVNEFNNLINSGIKTTSKGKELRKLYISRQKETNNWFVRKQSCNSKNNSLENDCINVTKYYRNFHMLNGNNNQ